MILGRGGGGRDWACELWPCITLSQCLLLSCFWQLVAGGRRHQGATSHVGHCDGVLQAGDHLQHGQVGECWNVTCHSTSTPTTQEPRSFQYSDTPLQAAAESLMQAVQCSRTLVALHTQLDSHTDWIKELAEAALTQERTHHSHILQHSPHHASPYRRQLKAVCAPLFAPVAKDQNMCKNCICHSSCA